MPWTTHFPNSRDLLSSNDFYNHIYTILHHERLKVLVQYHLALRDYCADLPDLGRSNRV